MSELIVLSIIINVSFLTLLNNNGLSNGLHLNWCPVNNNETATIINKEKIYISWTLAPPPPQTPPLPVPTGKISKINNSE